MTDTSNTITNADFDPPADYNPSDFWCIAAVDYDLDDGYIVKQSVDCRVCDLLSNGPGLDENGILFTKEEVTQPGLYRLRLSPWSHQSYEGEWDGGLDVTEWKLIAAFPELEEAKS